MASDTTLIGPVKPDPAQRASGESWVVQFDAAKLGLGSIPLDRQDEALDAKLARLWGKRNTGVDFTDSLGDGYFEVAAPGLDQAGLLKRVRQLKGFRHAEANATILPQAVPNDTSFGQLWALNNTGQSGGRSDADIDAPEAWDLSSGAGQVVGVIDSGIDLTHPDLSANVWTNPFEVAGNKKDDDGNGYVDDVRGWDFVNNDNNPMDDNGHGTHVAGTIAAVRNNGRGITGVAPGAKVMALKFLNRNGSGSTSNAIKAINYAIGMKQRGVAVNVLNNSWGGGGYSQSLYNAIKAAGDAGILFVAAAGNEGRNNDSRPSYPASYNLGNIVSVASTTRTDGRSSFSNYGAASVDLGAPGSGIYSTLPNNRYGSFSGTSMATPHVAGAAALAFAHEPGATVAQVKAAILDGVDRVSSMQGRTVTGGRLNARGMLDALDNPSGSQPAAEEEPSPPARYILIYVGGGRYILVPVARGVLFSETPLV